MTNRRDFLKATAFGLAAAALRADSKPLRGIFPIMQSPYTQGDRLDTEVLAKEVKFLDHCGVHGVVWPQLASEVTLGAATAAAAVRRIGQTGELPSGRVRFDVEETLSEIRPVEVDTETDSQYDTPAEKPDLALMEGSDPIDIIVDAARWAPSGGNIQPWRFEADRGEIRMYLVPDRTTTMDVRHRGSYVAIGAPLFNARVAAASLGSLGECSLFPEGSPVQPTLLLDDPAAELDDERLGNLIGEVSSQSVQLIVTTLHGEFSAFGQPGRRYTMNRGQVSSG